MPTDLPPRRMTLPEPTPAGTLVYAAAVLLMLLISGVTLMTHADDPPAAASSQTRAPQALRSRT